MISTLRVGLRVRLPSGNVVTLLRREVSVWICEYMPGAQQRGEVEFSCVYLRKYGMTSNAGVERHAPETYCGSEEAGVRVSDRTTC